MGKHREPDIPFDLRCQCRRRYRVPSCTALLPHPASTVPCPPTQTCWAPCPVLHVLPRGKFGVVYGFATLLIRLVFDPRLVLCTSSLSLSRQSHIAPLHHCLGPSSGVRRRSPWNLKNRKATAADVSSSRRYKMSPRLSDVTPHAFMQEVRLHPRAVLVFNVACSCNSLRGALGASGLHVTRALQRLLCMQVQLAATYRPPAWLPANGTACT